MNPIRKAWEWLYPPKLRNKENGMAWIKGMSHSSGESAMNGRAVCTVRLAPTGRWEIEPRQRITARSFVRDTSSGALFQPGETMLVCAIPDAYLEPWKEDGITETEVSQLYSPCEIAKAAESAESNFHLADGGTNWATVSRDRTA